MAIGELFGNRTTDEQWEQIRPSISRENHGNILVASLATMSILVVMVILSLVNGRARTNQALYLVMFVLAPTTYLVARNTDPANEKVTRLLMYVLISLCLLYAAILGTVFNPDQNACTFPALILAVPVFFTDRCRWMTTCIVIHTIIFVCMTLLFVDEAFVTNDIINSCVFAAVGIFINFHMVNVRFRRMTAELRLAELSEKDLLTGVRNRNSFELTLDGYPEKCQRVLGCIYLDLNGLHELNESERHTSGDAELKCVGAALKEEFGEEDTYRIGGDEFVIFVLDPVEGELEERVGSVRRKIEQGSYHVSVGVAQAQRPDIDVNALLKQAELLMYDDKRRYYEQEGIDRRRRPASESRR